MMDEFEVKKVNVTWLRQLLTIYVSVSCREVVKSGTVEECGNLCYNGKRKARNCDTGRIGIWQD